MREAALRRVEIERYSCEAPHGDKLIELLRQVLANLLDGLRRVDALDTRAVLLRTRKIHGASAFEEGIRLLLKAILLARAIKPLACNGERHIKKPGAIRL